MDEPLAALDQDLKDRILSYLERAIAMWRIPTLFASHDLADVRRFAEKVVVIANGKNLAGGSDIQNGRNKVCPKFGHFG